MFKSHYSSSTGKGKHQDHEGLPMSLVSVNVEIIYMEHGHDVE